MSEKIKKFLINLIILLIFIGIVVVTTEVDWAQENSNVGSIFLYFWLILLLILGIVLPILFMYLAGNKIQEIRESDKRWFIIAIILYGFASAIPIISYIIFNRPPNFFIYLLLGINGLIPAFALKPKILKNKLMILIIIFLIILVPLIIIVGLAIGDIWSQPIPDPDNSFYYLMFWGIFCTHFYLFIALGWKFGGGTRRQSWNIYISGTLIQFSTLEDFLFYMLNGHELPGTWPWMENFLIDLKALFGRVPTDTDLLIFCIITLIIAILILFDVHGYLWKKIKQKK